MNVADKLKERVEKELEELLECDSWNGTKLCWVYQLTDIYKDIMEMEKGIAHHQDAGVKA